MTVTVDAAGGTHGVGVSQISWSHTIGASANLLIVAGSSNNDYNSMSATYNGSAMTQLAYTGGMYCFYMLNPPAGTHTVILYNSVSRNIAGGSVSFNGVATYAPFGTPKTYNANSAVATTGSVVSDDGDLVFGAATIIVGGAEDYNRFTTDAAGQTRRFLENTWSNYTVGAVGSTKVGTSPSTSLNWNIRNSNNYRTIGVAIKGMGGKVFQVSPIVGL